MSSSSAWRARYGPWALVTGAAQGLGAAFARELAARGLRLVLVDQLDDELERLADALRAAGTEVQTVVADLARPEGVAATLTAVEALEIGLLVSNAAFAPVGRFLEVGLEAQQRTAAVNVLAPLALVHGLAGPMVARRRGGILLLSSASALQGTALTAGYAASKAHGLILAESLWEELRGEGVDVLGLMPGLTRTPGLIASRPRLPRLPGLTPMEPRAVVREGLAALGRRPCHIAGATNRGTFALGRLLPRAWMIRLMGRTMRGLYGRR